MSLIYKTLFEVKLTHEFYQMLPDGKNIFELTNQSDRISFLLNQFSKDMPVINDDLDFIFPPELGKKYQGYYLKILRSYSGFKMVIRVNQKILADGSLVFEPLVPLPNDFNINIILKKKSGFIEAFSNSDISYPIQAEYIFSNENIFGAKAFPFLPNSISAFDGARTYSQGDIASYGLNDIREYYNDGSADKWDSMAGSSFANENDRLLVPLRFYYSFINDNNVTSATFSLKDKSSNIIKTISVSGADFIQKALLDFSDFADVISIPETFAYQDFIFSLEVAGNNGYSKTHSLIFSDSLYNRENWGIINMRVNVTNPSFNLLGADGYLLKRRVPPGTWNEAPIFEIPIKSKFPFWRFINEKGSELKLNASLTDYLLKEGKILLSKRPRSLAGAYFLLQKEGSTNTVYVPNPLNYDLKKDDKNRLCLDILVSESDLFPTA